MAVYLGNSGTITLQRVADGEFRTFLDPGDVSVAERRFSVDFKNGTFVTGDRVAIQRLNPDGSPSVDPLDFINGVVASTGAWFVHVDALNGLRLYDEWSDSLVGLMDKALELNAPATGYDISLALVELDYRCVGEIRSYEFNTSRNSIDVTALGDAFTENVSGLISGSGSLEAFWDWAPGMCSTEDVEYAQYLHQLILRQQVGSRFKANLIIKRSGAEPVDDSLESGAKGMALMYQVEAVATNAGLSFAPSDELVSRVDFVTTGEIKMTYEEETP